MKKLISVIGLCVMFLLPSYVKANDFTLRVSPIIPENQQGENITMFNLKMKPGESKTYKINVVNTGDEKKEVDIMIVDASTLSEGVIDKTNENPLMVSGAKNLLTDLTTLKDSNLIIKGNETKEVEFTIEAPKEEMLGISLGSIYVLDKNVKEVDQKTKDEGMMIHNQMGYPIEIMVTTSTKQLSAKLSLDKVEADDFGGFPSLKIPIANENPNIIPDLKVVTEIRKKGTTKVMVTDTNSENQLAPQAIFPHQVKLSDDKVKEGDYTATIKATSDYGEWDWEKDFSITGKQVKDINQRTTEQRKPTWLYILIAISALILLIISYLLLKIRKLSKRNDN